MNTQTLTAPFVPAVSYLPTSTAPWLSVDITISTSDLAERCEAAGVTTEDAMLKLVEDLTDEIFKLGREYEIPEDQVSVTVEMGEEWRVSVDGATLTGFSLAPGWAQDSCQFAYLISTIWTRGTSEWKRGRI